jgi:hypothetical protein
MEGAIPKLQVKHVSEVSFLLEEIWSCSETNVPMIMWTIPTLFRAGQEAFICSPLITTAVRSIRERRFS